MCVFMTCVGTRCQSHVRWLPSRRRHMARSRACCAAPNPPPRSDLDLRRSRLLATTADAHLLKPANSHGRAIMNSWLVPAQTGVSAVNLRKPTSTPHLARQRLSRETHTPEPPAGVTGTRAQRACYGAKCELCTCACGHTVHSGTGCIFSPIPENHLYRLLAFRWEDSKLQFCYVLDWFVLTRNGRIDHADAWRLRSDADAGSGLPRRGRRRPARRAISTRCCICRAAHVPRGPAPGAPCAPVSVHAAATRRAAHRRAGEQQGETRACFFFSSSSSTACARGDFAGSCWPRRDVQDPVQDPLQAGSGGSGTRRARGWVAGAH